MVFIAPGNRVKLRCYSIPYIHRKTAMKEITRINHLGLRVKDLSLSREFYEKLGFEEREMPSVSEWKGRDVPHSYMEKSRAA